MKEIITWLRKIEDLANATYLQAATQYAEQTQLAEFLKEIAEEEAWHYHVVSSALHLLDAKPEFMPAIILDDETNNRITHHFSELQEGLANNAFSEEELIRRIVEVEKSEWNDIFVYVVNSLAEKKQEFKYPAIRMQSHLKKIHNFIDTLDQSRDILSNISTLPPVWIEKILIVEDESMISQLIKSLLNRDGDIDIAVNGAEALEFLKKKYYKLIISDIQMPVMDGITFYAEAKRLYPTIHDRFLFISGNLSIENQKYIESESLPFLAKPMDIAELQRICSEILLKV